MVGGPLAPLVRPPAPPEVVVPRPSLASPLVLAVSLVLAVPAARAAGAAPGALDAEIARRAAAVGPRVIAWRRDVHQHPELSNREERTARVVAEQLTRLGLEVRTGVAHHGVVA